MSTYYFVYMYNGTDTVSHINNDCRPWVPILSQSYVQIHGRNGHDALRYEIDAFFFYYLLVIRVKNISQNLKTLLRLTRT